MVADPSPPLWGQPDQKTAAPAEVADIEHDCLFTAAGSGASVNTESFIAAVAMAEAARHADVARWNQIRCATADRMETGFVSSRLLADLIIANAHRCGITAADAWQWMRAQGHALDQPGTTAPTGEPEGSTC